MISVKDIDACLPQTQCGQCSYDGCKPYAEAIAQGVPHNQCPPGGKHVIAKLSKLLKREVLPLNPENGIEKPKVVAVIREAECIGCTKCIQACPVDAIIGKSRKMHSIITDECNGCDLCVEPCPVDCIDMVELALNKQPSHMSEEALVEQANHYRNRKQAKDIRLKKRANEKMMKHKRAKNVGLETKTATKDEKQAFIAQAIERAKLVRLKKSQNEQGKHS